MVDRSVTETLEDVDIIFRNFSGKEGMYNREGDRNFTALLNEEQTARLLAGNWNVKMLAPRPVDEEDEEVDRPSIPITVNFDGRPPKIVMITSAGKVTLSADTVGSLDFADIQTVDLIIRAYDWSFNGKSGRKAYLKSMFVTVDEDDLERKYSLVDGDD